MISLYLTVGFWAQKGQDDSALLVFWLSLIHPTNPKTQKQTTAKNELLLPPQWTMEYLESKYQVIQVVTFLSLSPLVGGHQQPFKGSLYTSQKLAQRIIWYLISWCTHSIFICCNSIQPQSIPTPKNSPKRPRLPKTSGVYEVGGRSLSWS